jgi:hypothetical protein
MQDRSFVPGAGAVARDFPLEIVGHVPAALAAGPRPADRLLGAFRRTRMMTCPGHRRPRSGSMPVVVIPGSLSLLALSAPSLEVATPHPSQVPEAQSAFESDASRSGPVRPV